MTARSDVLVVGAGSAGAVLAARLSEDPRRRVTLLEAGPDYPRLEDLPPEVRFGNVSELDPTTSRHKLLYEATTSAGSPPGYLVTGQVVGGGSAINGQVWLRGVPEDYDGWAARGNDLWSFERVLPYFRKSERDLDFADRYHGTDGPIPVRRFPHAELLPPQVAFMAACRDLGHPACADHNHPESTGVASNPHNNVDGVRMSTAICYLAPARARPNLTIRAGTRARRLLFDGARAVGVEVVSDGAAEEIRADEVVLCAGAVGSPRLLQLAGIGPAARLRALGIPVRADRPGVGENLQDHTVVRTTWKAAAGFTVSEKAMRSQVCLRYSSAGSARRNDMKLSCASYSWVKPDSIDLFTGVQANESRGAVLLQSADPDLAPRVDLRFLAHDLDRLRLREAVELALLVGRSPVFRGLIAGLTLPEPADEVSGEALDDYVRRNLRSSMHVSCTCAMGPANSPAAVVDQEGRVHGFAGLRVVDASIMPELVRNNPQATIVMMAERIADLMRARE